MKRLMLAIALSLGLLVPNNISSAAESGSCPDKWGISLPELQIVSTSGVVPPGENKAGMYYQWLNSSYGDFSLDNLLWVSPSLAKKLNELGRDVVATVGYEFSESMSFNQPKSLPSYFPVVANRLRVYGVSDSSFVRAQVTISMKGCVANQKLVSNSVAMVMMSRQTIDLDTFFSIKATDINFQQEELIRQWYVTTKSVLIVGANLNTQLPVPSKSFVPWPNFGWIPVGIEPAGCIESFNPNSWPPYDSVYVVYRQLPCKVGILFASGEIPSTYARKCPTNMTGYTKDKLIQDGFTWRCIRDNSGTLVAENSVDALSDALQDRRNNYQDELVDILEVKSPPAPTVGSGAAEKFDASKTVTLKKTTILCVKGKLTKKITAVKPSCPPGYRKK